MQKVWIRCSLNRWNIFAEQCRDWVEIRFCCDSSGKVFNGSSDLGQLRGLLARLLFHRTGYGIKKCFGLKLNVGLSNLLRLKSILEAFLTRQVFLHERILLLSALYPFPHGIKALSSTL